MLPRPAREAARAAPRPASRPVLVEAGRARGRRRPRPRRRGRRSRRAPSSARPAPRRRRTHRGSADHGDRHVAQRVRGQRPRGPVERVLQLARDRGVVLRRGEQERIGAARWPRGSRATAAAPAVVVVLVVGWDGLEAVPDLELDVAGPARRLRRSSFVLSESRGGCRRWRGLFIVLHLLDEEQLGDEGDVVREGRLAVRERVVPVDAERRAVDGRVELEADALAAVRVGQRDR